MDENKISAEIAFRYAIIISTVALIAVTVIASVALVSMQIQSTKALEAGTKVSETYVPRDYGHMPPTTTIGEQTMPKKQVLRLEPASKRTTESTK